MNLQKHRNGIYYDVDTPERRALVRAVVARDWSVAMETCPWDHEASASDLWGRAFDEINSALADLPCADDFVAELLGER